MLRPLVILGLTMATLIVGCWVFLISGSDAVTQPSAPTPRGQADETVSVGSPTSAPAIAPGFVGFSIEYQSIAADTGTAAAPDPLLDRLVESVNLHQRPVIRIGGDSTDHTWYPVAGASQPGLTYTLTPAWISSVAGFARSTDAELMLGIDLEMDNPKLAAVEADQLEAGIGSAHILAWEVGNEPNLYASFPWYVKRPHDPRTGVYTQPRNFSFSEYLRQYNATADALPKLTLAGPALGTPTWMGDVGSMLKADTALRQVTYHAYPLNCFAAAGSPAFPSVPDLLSTQASEGLADQVAPFVREAAAARRSFRVDELNSSACGGATGVSNTFASALWATDTLFAMASQGVSGVNIQDFNSSRYRPFSFSQVNGTWTATVSPLYYGLLLFSQAAPAGSRLLSVHTTGSTAVTAWAAQTPATGASPGPETVTLINHSISDPETVAISVPHTVGGELSRLLAPAVTATGSVTLGGLSYGASTTTAELSGHSTVETVKPAQGGTYRVTLAPASAALLSLHGG